jgi:hypothetical protein
MKQYIPPKGFFDPLDLALIERTLESAWSEIRASNLIELAKDDALKRAVCRKLFSLIRTRPTEVESLRTALLSALSAEPSDDAAATPEH